MPKVINRGIRDIRRPPNRGQMPRRRTHNMSHVFFGKPIPRDLDDVLYGKPPRSGSKQDTDRWIAKGCAYGNRIVRGCHAKMKPLLKKPWAPNDLSAAVDQLESSIVDLAEGRRQERIEQFCRLSRARRSLSVVWGEYCAYFAPEQEDAQPLEVTDSDEEEPVEVHQPVEVPHPVEVPRSVEAPQLVEITDSDEEESVEVPPKCALCPYKLYRSMRDNWELRCGHYFHPACLGM